MNPIIRPLRAGESKALLALWAAAAITALVEKDHPWAVAFWGAAGYDDDARMSRFVRTLPPAS